MNAEDFYRAFEDKFRGSRDLIKSRLEVYLPFVMPLQEIYEKCDVLDIGCGRGEWLELMSENGFNATGVDLDDRMLEACKEHGLNAINKDALLTLQELPDESQVIVSGFHIAEHLPFETLLEIVKEAKRVLKPAGLLIMETPNPENICVGTNNFYIDPTHNRPIPSKLLSYLPEFYGYNRIKVMGLQEGRIGDGSRTISIFDVYFNSSPDYAVLAQKDADLNLLSLFDNEFAKDYGLSIDVLCNRFEEGITNRFDNIEAKAQSAEAKAQNAEAKAQSAEVALNAIYASRSWKITAPFRAVGDFIKFPKQKTKDCLKLVAAKCVREVEEAPKLKKLFSKLSGRFPKIESRFNRFYVGYYLLRYPKDEGSDQFGNLIYLPLTSSGKQIYSDLKIGIKQKRGHN